MKKILLIIAPEGFRDEEYTIPLQYFKNRNYSVDTASTRKGNCYGKLGMTAIANKSLNDIKTEEYDAIVFIGGPGTPLIRKDDNSLRIAREAYAKKKIIAAICWAPTILAKAGILNNRKATVWQGNDAEFRMLTSEYLEKQGAYYTGEPVTIDGNIITADGPSSAKEFAEKIINALEY
ncbi:MAG: DJ-1 family protein [Candidatus Woesearchaeota archaeon]|nr:MAG: DJ-1 family protein [Candidatus Woesearchaeota archaeon]